MRIINDNNYNEFLRIVKQNELEDLIEFSHTVKVLYVDNDPERMEDCRGIFKIFFNDIDFATNGEEGYELFNNNRYNLIITAIDMPVMNGVEMISKIREISRHITILALNSEERYFVELIRYGIDGYILLPIEVQQFVSIMQKVLETLYNKQGLYEYRVHLEDMVAEKTKKLTQINQNLEQRVKEEVAKSKEHEKHIIEQSKMAAMGDMIGNIAHQWRQPLSVITTIASGIAYKQELGILKATDIADEMEHIIKSAAYLSETIETFRNFLKQNKSYEDVCIQESIERVLNILNATLKYNNISVINNLPKTENINLHLVTGELEQVVINIINNSKDVFIEKKMKKPWIQFDISTLENSILITIEDNGGGIPDDVLPRIFEPYFSTKHKNQGTGLGLHMSYKIICESLEGKLYAKNTQNGAKFFIELPIN